MYINLLSKLEFFSNFLIRFSNLFSNAYDYASKGIKCFNVCEYMIDNSKAFDNIDNLNDLKNVIQGALNIIID